MTFARRRTRLTMHFSERIPVVKRRISVQCRMVSQGGCTYQLSVNAHSPTMFSAKQQHPAIPRLRSNIMSYPERGGSQRKVWPLHSVGNSLPRWAVAPNKTPKNLWPVSIISAAYGTVQSKLWIRPKDYIIRTEIFAWIFLCHTSRFGGVWMAPPCDQITTKHPAA
jgi:hypothetical protein